MTNGVKVYALFNYCSFELRRDKMAEKTTVETKKAEEVKEVAAKTTAKTTAKKTAAKKETAKAETKTTAKKETTAKKTTAKKETAKTTVESNVFIQTSYCEIVANDVIEKALNAYKEEGNKTKAKNINVYIKPEENAAYYVINDKIAGKVDIF